MITHDEFRTQRNIYWLNLAKVHKWQSIKQDLLHIWLEKNIESWWFAKNEFYCFGTKHDLEETLTLIKLGSFDKDQGEI